MFFLASTAENNVIWHQITVGILIATLLISLVIVFCVILIRLYFTKIQKYTAQLYQKDLDYEKASKASIIETQEQVLQYISQELHDDAGQQLTYLNFQLENLKLDLPELSAQLQPLSQSAHQLSKSIRSISHSLNNQLILQKDLQKAIESEVERIKNNGRIAVSFQSQTQSLPLMNSDEKILIFRIFQESINNILKHAKAKNIMVKLSSNPQFLLSIADDGNGFNPSAAKQKGTLGLLSMAARAEMIRYDLKIDSEAGNGCRITLQQK